MSRMTTPAVPADGDPFLRHPAAIAFRDGARQRRVPVDVAGFPAEGDAGAAVFVVRFDHVLLAMRAQVRQQIDRVAIAHHASVFHDRRPRNVPADDLALVRRKKAGVALVGEDGKKRLLVRNLAAQRVRHADGARGVGLEQRTALGLARDDIVDEHAAVDHIDAAAVSEEPAPARARRPVFEIARVADDRRHAEGDERVAQDLELAERRHLSPVDDGHQRWRPRAAPFTETRDQRVEQRLNRPVHAHVEPLAEARHQRFLREQLGEPLAVAGAGRRLAVVFGELQRVGQDEGVGAGRGAGRLVAGLDPRQANLLLAEGQLTQHRRGRHGHLCHALAKRPQRFSDARDARLIGGVEEERPHERADDAVAEPQTLLPHPFREARAQGPCGLRLQQTMPVFDGRRHKPGWNWGLGLG
jgi:hypothetical protein